MRDRKVSQGGWGVGSRGRGDGGNEVGQEGQAELAHLTDYDKEVDSLLGQQQAIGGSQM